MKIKFENIFRSAEFKLTMFYFLILTGISLVFNLVIFTTILSGRMEISDEVVQVPATESFRNSIIEARNIAAEKQIFESIAILDICILILGGWGSLLLARKTLAPLEKAHQLQSEFVSNASHEIRTPLATIQLETELVLKDKKAKPEDLREILASNLEEAKSLTALTENLLKLSKIKKLKLEKVNLNEIVRRRVNRFEQKLINFIETKDFIVHANENAIDELATILIDNALKYNISDQPIIVEIKRQNRMAMLEVTNYSDKLSQNDLDKMFERFYRADTSRSCNGKCQGYGLGLSIAQKLVENLNGSLTVRNEKTSKTDKEQFKTTFSVGLNFER